MEKHISLERVIAELEAAVEAAKGEARKKHTFDLGGHVYAGRMRKQYLYMPSNCTLCNGTIRAAPWFTGVLVLSALSLTLTQ